MLLKKLLATNHPADGGYVVKFHKKCLFLVDMRISAFAHSLKMRLFRTASPTPDLRNSAVFLRGLTDTDIRPPL